MTSLAAEVYFASLRALKKYFFKMVNKCCTVGCGNFTCLKEGVSVHGIPYSNNDNPEAKRRRKRWIDFVRVRRDQCEPGKTSSICAQHFRPEDYQRMFNFLPGQEKPARRLLKQDHLGICVFPTIQPPRSAKQPEAEGEVGLPRKARGDRLLKRKVSNSLSDINTIFQ